MGDNNHKDWDCPMKDRCYGCIPSVILKLEECTDEEEKRKLTDLIEYLRTHIQVGNSDWRKKNNV
jgi:hypothetical protein